LKQQHYLSKSILSILSCTLIFLGQSVRADENQDINVSENTIVITSLYRETGLLESATNISVLTENVIEEAGEQHLEELINLIPNLNWAGGSSRPRYFQLRGIGELEQYEGAPNPSVGVVIDDIDFSGIGMVATLFDTKQIEVLKGPQSARYGANAIAGLINIKTQDPSPERYIKSQFLLADDNTYSAAVSTTGALSDDQSVTGLFSVQQYQANGFRNNSFLNRNDTNGRDELSSRAKVHWQIDSQWHLAVTAMFVDLNNGYDAFAIDNSLTTLSDKPGKDSQRSVASSARLTYDSDTYQFVSITTYADSDIVHSFDGDWGNDESWGVNGPYDFTSDNQRQRRTSSQEFRISSKAEGALKNGDLDWLFGLYQLNLEEDNQLDEFFNGFVYRDLTSNFDSTNTALFAEFTQHFDDFTEFTIGLRSEQRDANYKDSTYSQFAPSDQMLGGNLTLKHTLESGLMSWASISRGYKAGGFNISLSVPADLRQYEPEYLVNYEIGIKGLFLGNKLSFSSSIFYMDRQQMQISTSTQLDPNDPLTFIFLVDNAAQGFNRGLEAELHYQLSEDWILDANLGLLDTKIESYDASDQTLVGRAQAHAPKYSAALAATYRNQKGWFARMDLQAKDEFFFSNSHQQKSKAYALMNTKFGYETNQWSVYLWARNLLNKKYYVRGFFFANEPPDWIPKLYTRQGDPRQVGITLRYSID